MPIDIYDSVQARLTAYIAPNTPRTSAQKEAFELAVEAQVEYEKAEQSSGLPAGIDAFKLGDFSAEMKTASASAVYSRDTLSPYAWALLYNAGLLRRGAIPVARRY